MMSRMILPIVIVALVICNHGKFVNLASAHFSTNQAAVIMPHQYITDVTLQVREELTAPIGQPQNGDRSIGFADVFLTLDNSQQDKVTLTVEQIQIQDLEKGCIWLISQTPQEIHLMPLERSINDFHLENKTGFANQRLMKVIVKYRVGEHLQTIESKPVEVRQY